MLYSYYRGIGNVRNGRESSAMITFRRSLTRASCLRLALLIITPAAAGADTVERHPLSVAPAIAPSVQARPGNDSVAAPALPLAASAVRAAAEKPVKQAVFLICPFKAGYSAWSVYMLADKNDPAKLLSAGLETLKDKNAKDTPYEEVLKAQADDRTPREPLAELPLNDFGRREIGVTTDDALHLSLTPAADGAYDLMLSMRVGLSDRFVLGGKEKSRNAVSIRFNPTTKTWTAYATRLTDTDGENHGAPNAAISGIVFPVSLTGIYRVFGVLETGETALLMDR